MTELLITHGANVNAMDLWQFTPLHEAASKSRTEVTAKISFAQSYPEPKSDFYHRFLIGGSFQLPISIVVLKL